jgi:hypothetical protein
MLRHSRMKVQRSHTMARSSHPLGVYETTLPKRQPGLLRPAWQLPATGTTFCESYVALQSPDKNIHSSGHQIKQLT